MKKIIKRYSLLNLLVVLGIALLLFLGGAGANEDVGYHYRPKKDYYVFEIIKEGRVPTSVIVHFVDDKDWPDLIKKHWPKKDKDGKPTPLPDPWTIGGITIYFATGPEIFIPKYKGEVDCETLGHEIAHIFDDTWHSPKVAGEGK